MSVEVHVPESVDDAIAVFGDGSGVTVIAGGTIVMPDLAGRRLSVSRAVVLTRAGLAGITRRDGTVTIGAATPLSALIGATPDPLSTAAQRVGDYEIRGQATIGGNLCAAPGIDAPRGDLQAPLIALGATVRSTGAGGERTDPVEDFLAAGAAGRLVLDVSFAEPAAGAYASLGRPHAHLYTIMSVACAQGPDGVRVALGGAAPRAIRASSVEQALAAGAAPEEAGARALDDAEPVDDALASAWYRTKTLPALVAQALAQLGKEPA